jgi:sugar phosphate isomerase/epimerase
MGRQRIGMSVALPRLDIESAIGELADLDFDAVEVHLAQIGTGVPSVPVFERAAEEVAELARRAGLCVTGLNAVDDPSFAPFGDGEARERTVQGLAHHLRLAAAMDARTVVIWDGRTADRSEAARAPALLAECIQRALERCALQAPPAVSIELHPFTFGLAHDVLGELAQALLSCGAGICADFCHLGVARGALFHEGLAEIAGAINHVHFSDSDCESSELHMPPGLGVLDLDTICDVVIAGRDLDIGWDLFGWPAPREAMREHRAGYLRALERTGDPV